MALTQHVFISYAHEDGRPYRDQLIAKLKGAGFEDDDYWYDERDIEPGEEWREAIDKALAESFIVVVILTPLAVKSHFVTYEWASALGDGLKVIPLVFERIPNDLKHPLVDRKQWEDCTKDIPERVIETAKKYGETPPDTIYLNRLIFEMVMPLRIIARVSLWLYQYANSGVIERDVFLAIIGKTYDYSGATGKKLEAFMIDKSHAFTAKQRRKCRELILKIDVFYRLLAYSPEYPIIKLDHPESIANSEKHREKVVEPAIRFFSVGNPEHEYIAVSDYLQTDMKYEINPFLGLFLSRYLSKDVSSFMGNAIEAVRKSRFPQEE